MRDFVLSYLVKRVCLFSITILWNIIKMLHLYRESLSYLTSNNKRCFWKHEFFFTITYVLKSSKFIGSKREWYLCEWEQIIKYNIINPHAIQPIFNHLVVHEVYVALRLCILYFPFSYIYIKPLVLKSGKKNHICYVWFQKNWGKK